MKFDQLDSKMRVFESAADLCVLPGIYMVARLDGRGFTRLTKEHCPFEAPFDERFRDLMSATTQSLMTSGFNVVYAQTHSDEISLLFAQDETQFGRKLRKYNSTLAAEASARFSLLLGQVATFDCRVSQLPSMEVVVDYFRWRSEDAARNALNAYCYWTLRKQGRTRSQATASLQGLSVSQKNELLFQHGINFNDVPSWQKRGIGFYWDTFEKASWNPKTAVAVVSRRRRIRSELELPMKDSYAALVRSLVASNSKTPC